MKSEKLLKFALKQVSLIVVVMSAVPLLGIVSLILLSTISSLVCEQLNALMILTALITAISLAYQQLRGDISKL